MPGGISATAKQFKFKGQRHTNAIKNEIEKIHNRALEETLRFLVEETARRTTDVQFTGETMATFRQFRDHVSKTTGNSIALADFPNLPRLTDYRRMFSKWPLQAKIDNLPNAGNAIYSGAQNTFFADREGVIGGAGGGGTRFVIAWEFFSAAESFTVNPNYQGIFDEAKKVYKKAFKLGLNLLFDPFDFTKELLKYANRTTIRSK